MFENAIETAQNFTRAVLAISRTFESAIIQQESATIFFVNEFGFAVTTGDVVDRLFPSQPYYEQYEKFKKQKLNPDCNIDKLKLEFGYDNSNSIIELKTMFLDCGNTINRVHAVKHLNYNIGLLYFEDVPEFSYSGYAHFVRPDGPFKKGKELIRLGYPFPQSSNYLYNSSRDEIEWDMSKPFVIESFPLRGMITRQFVENNLPIGIEMSTPGNKGHEGSPLFDENGYVFGIHCGNSTVETKDPYATFGNCLSSQLITKFLLEAGVKFYQIEDGKEVVYNEKNTTLVKPPTLVPTFFIGGEGESSMRVEAVKMIVGDKVVVDYSEPFEVSVGKMDDNSKKDGSALVQFSIERQNEIFITEENAGRVRHLENANQYQLSVVKKETKSSNWKVKASVKTQSYFPYYYFDILIIRRNAERDHLNDPHVTFFPDASGKYIRCDNEKSIKIVTKKTIQGSGSAILPLKSTIQADEFEIDIGYTLNENVLSISELSLIDKSVTQ